MTANPQIPAIANAIFDAVRRAHRHAADHARAHPARAEGASGELRERNADGRAPTTVAASPEAVAARLAAARYLADEGLATAIFLAIRLGKPLLLEGAPGVGKTEAAKVLARAARPRSGAAAML